MPVNPTYPGVYIDELPSQVHTIVGVPTSITAFVGPTNRGPVGGPTHITSWSDYQRIFGGLDANQTSYGVYQFYQNGGVEAEIVRVAGTGGKPATLELGAGGPTLTASSTGGWGNSLQAIVTDPTKAGGVDPASSYNLTIVDTKTSASESYLNVSIDPTKPNGLANQLATSQLVTATPADADKRPVSNPAPDPAYAAAGDGADGATPQVSDFNNGIDLLANADIVNIVCLPDTQDPTVVSHAGEFCQIHRSFLIVDPGGADLRTAALPNVGSNADHAAVYYPNVTIGDPANNGALKVVPPSGTMAGVYARTDGQRGVWKAPAGTAASLNGVQQIQPKLTDPENGDLNQVGVNALRVFPLYGPISWGARTLQGADALASQWKYVPIRRLALFIEESLFRGTKWVVFEPNDEPLWSAIRLNVGAFMNDLFRQGAFQGSTPQQAYLVKCDAENNPQNLIDKGIVTITVGFAPLKPAEFVIIQIEQLAGQLAV